MNIIYTPFIKKPVKIEPVDISVRKATPVSTEITAENVPEIKPVLQETPRGEEKKKMKPKSSTTTFSGNKTEFKSVMLPIYEKMLKEQNLNPAFAEYLVAQDALESGWGKHISGKNNLGGIKGKGTTLKTREVINGKDVYINDSFRDFDSLEDFARYKVNLLNSKRYQAFSGDTSEFASRVASGGYATDPRYKEVLESMVRKAENGMQVPELKEDTRSNMRRWWDNLKSDYQNSTWKKSAPAAILNTFTPTSIIDQTLSNDIKSGVKEAVYNTVMTATPVTNTARKIATNEHLLDEVYKGVKKVYDHYEDRIPNLFLRAQTYLKNKFHPYSLDERRIVPSKIERENINIGDPKHLGAFFKDADGTTKYIIQKDVEAPRSLGSKHAAEQIITGLVQSTDPKALRPIQRPIKILFGSIHNPQTEMDIYSRIMSEKASLNIKEEFENLSDENSRKIFDRLWNKGMFNALGETRDEFWNANKYYLTSIFKRVPILVGAGVVGAELSEIPEHKNGGILKFGDGGKTAKEFINNWYKNRDTQLVANQDKLLPLPAWVQRSMFKKNMNKTKFKVGETDGPTITGQYSPIDGIVVKDSNDVLTAIHEYTHSIHNKPAEETIKKIISDYDNIYDAGIKNNYLDNPSEMLSRLMEFRYKYKIDPNKHWTPNDIAELKNKLVKQRNLTIFQDSGEFLPNQSTATFDEKENILNVSPAQSGTVEKQFIKTEYKPEETEIITRYNDEFLSRVFNEVADNNEKDVAQYAQKGGMLDKNSDGYDILKEFHSNIFKIPQEVTTPNKFFEAMERVGKKYPKYDKELYQTIAEALNKSNQLFTPDSIAYLLASESGYNKSAKNSVSSAIGPFQYTKDTLKSIRPNDWENIYNQYVNGTRSNQLIADDAVLLLERISRNIKKDGNYGYGRLKINWLAPNAGLDQIISKSVYNNLTEPQKRQVPINSTYRFLMNKYDEWTNGL